MNHLFFINKFEDEFEIDLTGDEIADMRTIIDVKDPMKSKGVEHY